MRVRSIKFAALLLASSAALALPSASFSQTNSDVEYWRRYGLGPGRYSLMQICNAGRKINRVGDSLFDPRWRPSRSGIAGARNMSDYEFESFLAGQAAAMFEVCPDVR